MKRIKQLSENLINQIAAGEVIDRPSSAVKELLENAIDAGSTRIEVEISIDARNIRVADNGNGIYKEDILPAFSRHATSKIASEKDLWQLSTLGFRGEALASIISVAKVICTTRTPDSETGIKAECEDSNVKFSETGCAIGTTMELKELFYNTPARLKFLKQPQTEIAHITETIQNIAISHPKVAITLIHKKNAVLKTSGSGDLKETVSEIYSKDLVSNLQEVNFSDEQMNLKINGLTSSPNITRSNKKGIYVFVNGRTIRCPIISKAIDTAYKDIIPSGKYPFAVLNLTLPPNDIDINVHPSKKEIKYAKPNLIFNFVYTAVKNSLNIKDYTSTANEFSLSQNNFTPKTQEISDNLLHFGKFNEIPQEDITEIMLPSPKKQEDIAQNKMEFPLPQEEETYIPQAKIIGQLDNTYILIENNTGLQIIDQHIAHERYLYEELKQNRNYNSQLLLTSELVELDEETIILLRENIEKMQEYGFEIEFVRKDTNENIIALDSQAPLEKEFHAPATKGVRLKRIPQILSTKPHYDILQDLIESIKTTPENLDNEILEKISCCAAVKAGERLNTWQMEELIKNWQRTKFNMTCPHGRKISHIMPIKEIAKFFGRVE